MFPPVFTFERYFPVFCGNFCERVTQILQAMSYFTFGLGTPEQLEKSKTFCAERNLLTSIKLWEGSVREEMVKSKGESVPKPSPDI